MSKRLSITRVFQQVVKSANAVFRDEKPLIAVMGATGAGKSRFIKLASGVEVVESASLESCTSEIEEVIVKINGKKVALIDTPGFDDTNKSDTEILTLITNYLESNYRKDRRLTGIIFLHRITDNRMTGVSARSILMFEKLVGKAVLDHVVLCTTMWDLKEQEGEFTSREEQLKKEFWANMIEAGARTARHSNTPQSAREIVAKLINLKSTVLGIQKEMVDERKSLSQTSAGIESNKEVARLEEQQRKEMQRMREAKDRERAADAARMDQMLAQQREENARRLREEEQASAWRLAERERELQALRERAEEAARRAEEARNQTPAIGITRVIAYNPNDNEHWGRTVEWDSEGECVTDAWVQLISQGTRHHGPVYYAAHRAFDEPYPEDIGFVSVDVYKYTGDAYKPAFVTNTYGSYDYDFTALGTVSADMSERWDPLREVQDFSGNVWWRLDYKVYLSLEWGTLNAWIEWQDQGQYLRSPQTSFSVHY